MSKPIFKTDIKNLIELYERLKIPATKNGSCVLLGDINTNRLHDARMALNLAIQKLEEIE